MQKMQGSRMYSHAPYATNSMALYHKPAASSSVVPSEQSLIEEVRFLHSLWRKGPPPKRTSGENPPPPPAEENIKRARLEPGTDQKKRKDEKRKQSQAKKQQGGSQTLETKDGEGQEAPNDDNWNPASVWNTENPSAQLEWTSSIPKTETLLLNEEELVQFAQLKLQQKAARAFKEFLTKGRDDESGESEDEDEDGVDEDEDEDKDSDEEEFKPEALLQRGSLSKENDAQKFIEKLFGEDEELRRFYEQNCNCGAFECLVCAAIGAKLGKKFPDCVSLTQHAMKILKTKKKAAHRGYGRAICALLGWSSERLPSLPKTSGELKPRGCIPPPDEVEAQGPEEGSNEEETDSDSEAATTDDNEGNNV